MAKTRTRKSGLTKRTNARRNTKAGRKRMSSASFGLPQQRKYRLDTRAHAVNALARAAQHATPAQRAQIRRRAKAKYPSIGQR
jgi:hypothetical protein